MPSELLNFFTIYPKINNAQRDSLQQQSPSEPRASTGFSDGRTRNGLSGI
jgi:hypothetical protein